MSDETPNTSVDTANTSADTTTMPVDPATAERQKLVNECLKCNNEQNNSFLEQSKDHYKFQKTLKSVGRLLLIAEGALGVYLGAKVAFGSYPDPSDRLWQDVILCLGLLIITAITLKLLTGSGPGTAPRPPSGIDDKEPPPRTDPNRPGN